MRIPQKFSRSILHTDLTCVKTDFLGRFRLIQARLWPWASLMRLGSDWKAMLMSHNARYGTLGLLTTLVRREAVGWVRENAVRNCSEEITLKTAHWAAAKRPETKVHFSAWSEQFRAFEHFPTSLALIKSTILCEWGCCGLVIDSSMYFVSSAGRELTNFWFFWY